MSLESNVEAQWNTWCQQAEQQGLPVPREPRTVESLKRVWEASSYVVQSCSRELELLPRLIDSGHLDTRYQAGEMSGRLSDWLVNVQDDAALGKKLRQFRRYQMVRIIWRDIAGWAPLAETLEDLTALADACIGRALDLLYAWTAAELGTPRNRAGDAQSLVVLGMGKLGARELNLSSDIDLIFAYPEAGQTDGERPKTNEQFFIRLSQRLVQALDTVNADGFVFRVDIRLRPFGSAGPLAMNFDAMESYYASQAREWERYAMIKARIVAGTAAGEQLMRMLRPFVYRRYLDYGAIESLREMKQLIGKELQKKGMDDNVKLGPGGIREIEFIGQAFQLIRGGRDKALQIRPILALLKLLEERDILPEYVVRELTEAYEFLRLAENRIQAWADKQTHLLPGDDESRLRLARAMSFSGWEGFSAELERHRKNVQCHFDMLFAAPQTEGAEDVQQLTAVWQDTLDRDDALEALFNAGFGDAADTLRQLVQFRGSHACRALGTKGRARLNQLMPMLLDAVGQVEADAKALGRVLGLLESIARRTAYIALLVENPIALSQLVRLSGMSPWISRLLTRHPILLDELLDPRRLYSPLNRSELESELTAQLAGLDEDDLENQMERLRLFAQSNLLRVAAADITEHIPLMVVSDYLTEIAETVIARVVELAWNELVRRHGKPPGLENGETGFAVVGYGKLGGIELGYASDLDMVFLHGIDNRFATTDGDKPIAVDVFYARMAQRMIHLFTTRTPAGILYEVDMRLRPNGNSGMLVSSMKTFESYQTQSAWTWEHQALVRARVVGVIAPPRLTPRDGGNAERLPEQSLPASAGCSRHPASRGICASLHGTLAHLPSMDGQMPRGQEAQERPCASDARVDARFEAVRREILSQVRDPEKLRAEVLEMREKMRGKLDKSKPGQFDLKQGFGGIVDIEFMVQYWVLRWSHTHPDLLGWTDNIRLLETLSRLDLLSGDTAERLMEAYRSFRAAYHRSALQDLPALVDDQLLIDERTLVREFWRQTFMDEGLG